MEHLIVKYLQGELTLDEQYELSKWMQRDKRNAAILNQIHNYWHYHRDNLEEEDKEVRSRLHDLIHAEGTSSQIQKRKKASWKVYYRVAASVVVTCSLIFGIYHYGGKYWIERDPEVARLIEKVSLPGQKITTILPDGTKVKLNADSKLLVPMQFEGDTREVTLSGEAFFDVKPDKHHPFIIRTEEIDIKVTGTSFNVQAYSGGTPQVAVRTGKVIVKNQHNDTVELIPNQMVQLKDSDLIKTPISGSSRPFAWTDQYLVFNDASFSQVLKKVSRWYGVQIDMEQNITVNKKYTANYDNPTLTEMMDVLAFVYGFNYKFYEKEKRIVIR